MLRLGSVKRLLLPKPAASPHHVHHLSFWLYITVSPHPFRMAPTNKIRCLACKKKGEKLEDWEYDAEPELGPEELGDRQTVQHPDLRLLCWHQLLCTCVSAQTERLSAHGHQHWEPRAKHARQPSLLRAELNTHHDLLD